MADDLDAMLQEEDSSSASPAETGQQNDSRQSDEEVEFNNQSGSAQERYREMYRRAREAESKLGQRETYVPPAPNTLAPDQEQAVKTLSQFGISTDEKVDQKISEGINTVRWEMEQRALSEKYSGSNGEPKYVREEVEDYIRNHPQFMGYAPEDVFKFKMFPDEFANLGNQTKPRTSSLRPTKSQGMNTSAITPDNVEEMVKSHDQDWYNENQKEINEAVAIHTRQFDNQGNRI